MSAWYVRSLSREWAESAGALYGVPYYDTINKYQDPDDETWFTLGFNSVEHIGTFCDPNYEEVGFVDVVFMGKSGTGDENTIKAVEQVIPSLMNFIDPTGGLAYESYEPIQEFSNGDADSTYRVIVSINYRYIIKSR